MSTDETLPDPLVGLVLDARYRLDCLIGRGGMGRVYRAEHVGLGRLVAIKVLDPALGGDDEARKRFEREAMTTARLRHPNCVGVTDFGALPDGSPYLVMDLVEGYTLDDLLAATPRLPLERALHILRHVLRGLGHAHAQGVVHRDLKPCNIMLVTEDGDRDFARILDFGLARISAGGDSDRITRAGIVCGTPRYMAPEQAQDRALDPRTDLYALSVIFFEMLAGRTPFDADEALRILTMHLKEPVPSIASVAPEVRVPPAVEDVLRRGLAKDPAARPPTAEAYLAELERAVAPPNATPNATIELSGVSLVTAAAPPPLPTPMPTPVPMPAPVPVGTASAALSVGAAPGPLAAPPHVSSAPMAAASGPVATARASSRAPLPIARKHLAYAGAALALLVVIGVVASLDSDDAAPQAAAATKATAPEEPEPEVDPAPATSPALDEAMRLARSGRGEHAVSRLRTLRREHPDAPQIPYALGRVYTRLGWPKQAIEAFRDAIELDRAFAEDPDLIGDLVSHLDSKSNWQFAVRVIERDVGAPAIPALEQAAERHRDGIVRERARRLRERLTP